MKFGNSIKKRPLIWSLFFMLIFSSANAQHFDWARSFGGLGIDVGRDVCTDSEGNVIIVGSFTGQASIVDTFLTGYGSKEAFVAKFTSNGDFLWARMISGPAEDEARGVVTDEDGTIYVVGHFTDTVVFSITETDTIAAKSEGGQDMYVAKYSANGDFVWFITGGGLEDDTATDIDRYKWSGKLYVCGGFQKRFKFGSQTLLSNGLTDAFVAKIDGDGNVHWVEKGGGSEHDVAAAISVDKTDESVYIIGDFYNQADFAGTQLEAVGSSDMFLVKYTQDGTMEWAKTNGGTAVDVATDIGTDLNGNIYVSGYYQGTTYFQNFTATAWDYNDVFLSKFDADGTCQWLSSAGSYRLDNCMGMDVAWDGTTYLTGFFDELMVVDGDSIIGNGYDIFVLNYSPSGEYRYGRAAGAGSGDFGMATCLGSDQSLYIVGYYFFFADFDNSTIGAADYGDGFLARMTDILGVESEKENTHLEGCIKYNTNSRKVEVNCTLKGDWTLTNLLGQQLSTGKIQNEFDLPKFRDRVGILSFKTESGTVSLRIFNVAE